MTPEEYERLQARLTDLQNKKERQPSSGSNWRDGWKDAILAVKSLIHSEFKTNSVEHGHWIIDDSDWFETVYRCTVCKKSSRIRTPYCPNCGAKMDERREE